MKDRKLLADILVAFMIAVLTVLICFFVEQHEFSQLVVWYIPLCVLYFWVNRTHFYNSTNEFRNFSLFLGLAIVLRFVLIFAFPRLSNDVFRFIWDGRLMLSGISPFAQLPEYFLIPENAVKGIDPTLFEAFGAKNTFSVYPPLSQWQFLFGVWLAPNDIYWSAVAMKIWQFIFEVGTLVLLIRILNHFKKPTSLSLLYALNPLIIIEISGNLHFEGTMIFFLLLAWWIMVQSQSVKGLLASAMSFSLAVGAKLLPLIFLPFLLRKLGWRKSVVYFLGVTGFTAMLFLPWLEQTFIANFGNSLNLYFQKLEFNASIYYLARWVGFQIAGYNMIGFIGPILGALAGVIILFLAHRTKWNDSWEKMTVYWLAAISIYLFSTTTLHPWYLSLPIALSVFTPWRFPLIWSVLIYGTYVNYSYQPFRENLYMVAFEYLILAGFLWFETKTIREKLPSSFG